ncbi:MAG: hypothetical protein ACLTLQ_09575 [[Clostridium] scindens]
MDIQPPGPPSLRNVTVTLYQGAGKDVSLREFGRCCSHPLWGSAVPLSSAPAALSASLRAPKKTKLAPGDWSKEPALDDEDHPDHRVLRDFEENANKQFKNALGRLFPSKLIPVMIQLSGIDPEKKVNVISKEERRAFACI